MQNNSLNFFRSLNDFTRHGLRSAGSPTEERVDYNALMNSADNLTTSARVARVDLLDRRKNLRGQEGDAGGDTNLFIEEFGPPRWHLVYECLEIFKKFRPGEATCTIGGPFYKFVCSVFDYATGRLSADHAKIDHWIKALVVPHRHEEQHSAKMQSLIDEENAIFKREPKLRILRISGVWLKFSRRTEQISRLLRSLVRSCFRTFPWQV